MENIKLRLADETEITIDEFQIPMHIVAVGTREELTAIWNSFTPEALASVSVMLNGSTLLTKTNAALDSVQFVQNPDGTYTAHFYMSGETVAADNEYTIAARILLGEVD